jgi:hypothetical protein
MTSERKIKKEQIREAVKDIKLQIKTIENYLKMDTDHGTVDIQGMMDICADLITTYAKRIKERINPKRCIDCGVVEGDKHYIDCKNTRGIYRRETADSGLEKIGRTLDAYERDKKGWEL